VAQMGDKRNVYRILVGLLGRPRRRWINNIMMGLLERVLGILDWICLTQNR
jgi:hypothetical protein